MIDTKIITFVKVAETGSFAKAAEELFISPTAVMKQINGLEAELKVTLLQRTNRGIALTEPGQSFLIDAKNMIRYYDESTIRAQEMLVAQWKTIRVGNSPMVPSYFLVDLWPLIQARCPNLRIQLVDFEGSSTLPDDVLGNCGVANDVVAAVWGWNCKLADGFEFAPLGSVGIGCSISINNPLAGKESLSCSDLLGEKIWALSKGTNSAFDAARNELEANPRIEIVDIPHYSTDIFIQCERMRGLLLSYYHWKFVNPMMQFVPIDWEHEVEFGLVYPDSASPEVRQFAQVAVEAAREFKAAAPPDGRTARPY